ncbi:right-handed parallel beta-helix repeat-containing protein [Gloeomargaritales cyanobacterium VI4D9]|nr:right-handed parallel beta-helix repeat-containing protein [Gloeomargaritales cyanobacterium VI4D9]
MKLVVYTVTLTTDSAVPVAGELRFEINQANGLLGADDIVFAPATNGIPIVLNFGQLNVTDPAGLTITGNGASNTIIDGGGVDRVFNVMAGDITFNDLTIQNGNTAGNGGGIFAFGTVTLSNSTVSGNTANFNGGGIFVFNGNVTLNNSEVSGNIGDNGGGGILVFNGNVTLNNSKVLENTVNKLHGGGIVISSGKLILTDSIVSGNKVYGQHGGGIYADGNNTTVTLNNSIVSNNEASLDGGGIYSSRPVTLTNSKVLGNTAGFDGGGIYVVLGGQISNSDITGNEAQAGSGGGIFNAGGSDLTISTSKITENEAGLSGAGIANDGDLTLKDVTVAGNGKVFGVNNGGGLANGSGGTAVIINSTLSGNLANNGGGIDNQGTLTMTNSTIGNNEANLEGGGIRNLGGDVTLKNVTIVGNKVTVAGGSGGGGIFNDLASTVTISNSIVAGNEDSANGVTKNEVVNQGTFTISGKNLVGQNGNLGGFPADPSNIVVPGGVIGVQVAPLANNGGFTETFALLPGSLAVNASGAGATASDQRGVAAVGVRDIGAFESPFSVAPAVPPVVLGVPVVTGEVLVLTAELGRFLTQEEERLLFQPYLCVGEVLLAGAPSPELPACVQSVNVRQGGELFDLLRN